MGDFRTLGIGSWWASDFDWASVDGNPTIGWFSTTVQLPNGAHVVELDRRDRR